MKIYDFLHDLNIEKVIYHLKLIHGKNIFLLHFYVLNVNFNKKYQNHFFRFYFLIIQFLYQINN